MADFLGDFGTPDVSAPIPSAPDMGTGFNFGSGGGFPTSILNQWGGGELPGGGASIPSFGGGTGVPDLGGTDWFGKLTGGLSKLWSGTKSLGSDLISPTGAEGKGPTPLSSILGIGATGLGAANSIMGMRQAGTNAAMQRQAMGTQRDISRAVMPSATELTQQGASMMLGGPLSSGIQAQVDDFKRKATAEINSYLAHAGIADSTEMAKWQMYIETQATLYGQQLASGLYGQGLEGLATAGGSASALSSTATNMNANVPASIEAVNKAIAKLQAQG